VSDSERSQAAREFVKQTYSKRPGLIVVVRDVKAKETDLDRYWTVMDHYQIKKPGLPAFHVSGRMEVGWDESSSPVRLAEALTVEVFVRDGCTRCRAAHPILFERLASRYPGYEFVEQNLSRSEKAAQRLQELSRRYRVQATSVPAVHLCGRLMVGFLDADTSFRQWDEVLRSVTVRCPPAAEPPARRSEKRGAPSKNGSARSRWMSATATAAEPRGSAPENPQAAQDEAGMASEKAGRGDQEPADIPPPRRTDRDEFPENAEHVETPPLQPVANSDRVMLPFVGEVHWREWGLPAFTLLVGLIDGFNPCAMWVLLFLLSLLVNLQDRWKILAVAGTFVVISAAAYLAFMAAWLNVFQLIGLLRPAQVILGLLGIGAGAIHIKDYFAFKKGVSLSIPESVKPGLYQRMRRIALAESLASAIVGASVLAVLVNVIELLCTAGLPALYTEILTLQNFSPWKNYVYLLLYIVAYMFDDSVMVAIVVVTLGRHKLQERGGRILKLISGLVVFALGVIMIFRPNWLV
jgi:glutaredoxin